MTGRNGSTPAVLGVSRGVINVFGGIAFVMAVYALWQVYTATDVLMAVKWGVAGLALFQVTVIGKSYMGTHLEANRVIR